MSHQTARKSNILVIGAGVSGLSTALCIKRHVKNVDVTVMSEHFPPENIVSMVAGGVVFVAPRDGLPPDVMRCVNFKAWYRKELLLCLLCNIQMCIVCNGYILFW